MDLIDGSYTRQDREHDTGGHQHKLLPKQSNKSLVKFILPPLPSNPTPSTVRDPTQPVIHQQRLSPKLVPAEGFVTGTSATMYGNGAYGHPTSGYGAAPIPQYTQTQINEYYQQYQCYPAQPYQIIPDYYGSSYVQGSYEQQSYSNYQTLGGGDDEVRDGNKSTSRQR
ncbi:hypothetical protein EJ04DRAFT_118736 [Polyplosphaeria fusca]|uniref:Uncharacterized protein n=1 Tax=Polyplosphaeria fusca TaxID=682080 RepID=A0A9P4R699_9PLEO|nr:hypothetical protein EJ04DRAFT_118736 [Polyplosphaeria fusca]